MFSIFEELFDFQDKLRNWHKMISQPPQKINVILEFETENKVAKLANIGQCKEFSYF